MNSDPLKPPQAEQTSVQALQARNEQLVAILEMGESGVIHAEANGLITHVNRALRRMFVIDETWQAQLTLNSFETQMSDMLDPAETLRKPITALRAQLARREAGMAPRLTEVIKLASPRRAVIQLSAGTTPQGGQVFYFRDITVEYEVDRMKSEFLATAAHELRTPLASIFGFTELMIARVMSPEKQRELLLTIHRQSQLLVNLINELLDLSRIESRQGKDFHRQHCRVDNLVKLTLQGLLVKGDRRQVSTHLPDGKERIMVDPEKTMQALLNVLSNAFKYSPQGGTIVLDTLRKGSEVGLRVTDQGLGMAPEHLERIFDRFFRVDPSGKIPGTGLGMSLVKEITELQDGRVQIESQLGRGTAVTLWFPLAPDFLLSRPFSVDES